MPGLLDILNSDDDGVRLGLGLLAAAAPSTTPTNNAARLAQAFGYVQQQKKQDVEQEYKKAMLEDAKQQAELRKAQAAQLQRKSDLFNQFFGGAQGGAIPQAGGLPQMGGAPGAPQIGAPAGMFSNVDPQAIRADLLLNDGKNIPEWMFKRNTPDIQVNNGYAYDRNRIQPGYLPSFNVSQDGKSSLVQIGPDGLPVVSAPRGALDTFNAYQNAGERAKASFDPQTITSPNGQTQITSRANLIDGIGGGQNMAFGGFSGDPSRVAASIQAIADPREREAAWAQFSQQMRNPGGLPGIPVQSEADKLAAAKRAEFGATQQNETDQKSNQFKDFRSQMELASNLLKQDPTHTALGNVFDKVTGAVGLAPKGAETAKALETVAGWMIQNIPKAPGAQSDAELRDYKQAIGGIGDPTLSIGQRQAALQTVGKLVDIWEKRALGQASTPAQASQPPANAMNALPTANSSNKGRKVRDLVTGEIMESDGMRWKKVQQ